MTDVTHILRQIESGDPSAAEHLLPLVYDELRRLAAVRLAHEPPGHTLQATALVHEAYLRLVHDGGEQGWDGRGHFFSAAAEAMRRILINRARDGKRLKRGGGRTRVDLDLQAVADSASDEQLLALDEALEQFAAHDPPSAELVTLRFFTGLTQEEAARALGIPRRTADRRWAYARAWLFDRLKDAEDLDPTEAE